MILCENLTEEELDRMGAWTAEAFLGEPGCFQCLSPESGRKLFTLILRTCYETGHLYTTSENREGVCVYWTKAQRPGFRVQLKMGLGMCRCMTLKEALALGKTQSSWKSTEKRYQKAEDFVEVFLLAVRKDCQGQGHFRKMLEEPFKLARQRGTLCVLDTDSRLKADKYCHVGMHVADRKLQKSGHRMYALEK